MSEFHFFTDVHIPVAAIEALRRKGINVLRSIEAGFTQDEEDETLLNYATAEKRVMITCDYDFEQLVYRWQAEGKPHASILYFNM